MSNTSLFGKKTDLSDREKLVLASIIQNPTIPDIEIASNIGVKHSTFATIKKRLYNQNYFKLHYIPNMTRIGSEICSIVLININELREMVKDSRGSNSILERLKFLTQFDNIMLASLETNFLLLISFTKNYTSLSEFLWKIDMLARKNQMRFESSYNFDFPLHFSNFSRFFDYSRSIMKHLNLKETSKPYNVVLTPKKSMINITRLGWKIYQQFLEYPENSPRETAEMIGKPRTTITRWLRSFTQNELLIPRIFPNLEKLGYKIYLMSHITIHSSQNRIINRVLELIDDILAPIILIHSDHNIFFLTLFSSFEIAQEKEMNYIETMNKEEHKFTLVFRSLFSIPHTNAFINLSNSLLPLLSTYYSDVVEINRP